MRNRKLFCNKTFKNLIGKKEGGISPLVATGILILIVIAAGIALKEPLITFVTSFITNATQQAQTNFFTT